MIYFFTRKKTNFSGVYSSFHGQRSVMAAWATHSPWSISIYFYSEANYLNNHRLYHITNYHKDNIANLTKTNLLSSRKISNIMSGPVKKNIGLLTHIVLYSLLLITN